MTQLKDEHENADSLETDSKVLIIDGLNTFIRAFAVTPTTNVNGVHVGGITGFLRSVGYAIKTIQPTRVIITFDGKGGSKRRKKLFPEYKANRKIASKVNRSDEFSSVEDEKQSMYMQIQRALEYLKHLPMTIVTIENIEADDSMAYISKQLLTESNIVIMSTDKDFLQLVNDRISVWSPTKKVLYNPLAVQRDYEIPPHNFLMYRILEGDKSDNIPGVKGVGLKTLVKRFPEIVEPAVFTVNDLFEAAETGSLAVHENILNSKDVLGLNYKLMQLHDVDISSHAKSTLRGLVKGDIPTLNKFAFEKMVLEDQIHQALPNLET